MLWSIKFDNNKVNLSKNINKCVSQKIKQILWIFIEYNIEYLDGSLPTYDVYFEKI